MIPDGNTRSFILIGKPVEHSLSPAIHNAAFQKLGLNCIYTACPVEEQKLGEALKGIRALSIAGANVTSPYKKAVIPFLDTLSAEAAKIESVNTIVNAGGILHGETTDGEGFYLALDQICETPLPDMGLTTIGAGGAVRAAAYTLASKGIGSATILNRTRQAGSELAGLLKEKMAGAKSRSAALDETGILENLASPRLIIYGLPFDSELFTAALAKAGPLGENDLLFDLRYHPARSLVMEAFESRGGRAFNGLSMLLWQAALAFKHFTGEEPPLTVMRKAAGLKNK